MSGISWREFVLFIAAALFLYYVWVLFIFYAKDLLRLFKQQPSLKDVNNESEELFGIVYRIQDEVKETITEAAQKSYTKEKVIVELQVLLEKYALSATPFKIAVNNFIERQCQNNCSIRLSEEEIQQLWK